MSLFGQNIVEDAAKIFEGLEHLSLEEKVDTINAIRLALHEKSPFKGEPVDCVLWVKNETVVPNDWNPNTVAPPEMKLLKHSVNKDGFTMPVVTYPKFRWSGWRELTSMVKLMAKEVVDGFHRTRTGKEVSSIKKRLHGYLPITLIKAENYDEKDRRASTMRHNLARGKHGAGSTAELVKDMVELGWDDEKIGKEIGMKTDEVTRLKVFVGLGVSGLFQDHEYSPAWE